MSHRYRRKCAQSWPRGKRMLLSCQILSHRGCFHTMAVGFQACALVDQWRIVYKAGCWSFFWVQGSIHVLEYRKDCRMVAKCWVQYFVFCLQGLQRCHLLFYRVFFGEVQWSSQVVHLRRLMTSNFQRKAKTKGSQPMSRCHSRIVRLWVDWSW